MKFFNPAKKHDYVLVRDRKSPKPTVFSFRRLTRDEMFDYAARAPFTLEQSIRVAKIRAEARREKRALKKDELKFLDSLEPKNFEDMKRAAESYAFAVQAGLTEIRGLLDENGKPLTMQPEAFTAIAPMDVVIELGEFVLGISGLSEADAKN